LLVDFIRLDVKASVNGYVRLDGANGLTYIKHYIAAVQPTDRRAQLGV